MNTEKISRIFWIVFGASLLFLFGKIIFNDYYYMYTGVGADTVNQYYPYILNEVISIREGDFSIWNWSYGLGTSLLNNITWSLDPFAILVVFLGVIFGPGTVQYLLVWMHIFKIVCMFVLGKKYLSYFLEDVYAINVGAYLIALNGYIMLWGQHYFLGTSSVFALLLLCNLENLIKNECKIGAWKLSITVALILFVSYYIGYMILVVGAVYFLFRYFTKIKFTSFGNMIKDLGRCLGAVLTGLMISGVIFVPSCYYVMTNSSRLGTVDTNILQKIWLNFTYFDIRDFTGRLSRLLSNNLLCIEDNSNLFFANYYEAPQLACTVFIFFFFFQWLVLEIKKAKSISNWVLIIFKVGMISLMVFNSVAGLILNAFAYASFRYTYLLFPFFGLCIGIVVQDVIRKKQLSIIGIVLGALATGGAWYCSYKQCVIEVRRYVLLVALIIMAGTLLLCAMCILKKYYNVLALMFVALMFASTVLDGWVTTYKRSIISKEVFPLEWEKGQLKNNTELALEWIKSSDKTFYRIAKNYIDWNELGDSLIENYSSVVYYNSTMNSNVAQYYEKIYPSSNTSFYAIKLFRLDSELDQRANDIVHTKYLLSKSSMDNSNWKLVNQFGDVFVYENNNSHSVGKWYTKTITKEQFETMTEVDRAEILKDTVVVDNDFSKVFEQLNDSQIGDFCLRETTHLEGTISCKKEGILMLALPHENGWEIFVDGEKEEIVNCNYGFIGVCLEAGNHTVSLRYTLPYGEIGVIVSLIGVLFIAIMIAFEKKYQNRREQND